TACAGKHEGRVAADTLHMNTAPVKSVHDSAPDMEAKIMSTVMSLPEAEKAGRYIDSISNHTKGVGGIIDGPEPDKPEYGVRIGYNGDERFETYYFFYVDTITFRVKVQDVALDTILPIEDWRRMKRDGN
ncbi:MAG: hypothetical protein ACXVP0_10605, partial [Bacteroidia bacterium]